MNWIKRGLQETENAAGCRINHKPRMHCDVLLTLKQSTYP
jgi:hypothetical protein